MAMSLTQYRLCPRSRSVRLALAEGGYDVDLVDENPWDWRQGFLAKNPAGEFPVLEFDNGLVLAGVYSISEFLAEDASPPAQVSAGLAAARMTHLIPGNREDRAEVRRLIDWFHGKFDREISRELVHEKVIQRMRPSNPAPPDADILRAVRTNLRYHLMYTSYLANSRRWLAGDDLSFADFAAAGHISVVDYLGEVPWSDFPDVKSWYQRIKSRPAFRTLLADRIPGTAPPSAYADLDF
ncbi:MAG: glutathione S-transferase family protein [Hyphomicrobium sp.]|nr:glutathione S-transferase family protein [Hyphomicrobium sp.]